MQTQAVRTKDPTARQSPTKLDLWNKCQAAWCFHYVERRRFPSSTQQALGRAADEAWNDYYRARIRDARGLTETEVLDLFENHWHAEASEVEQLPRYEFDERLDRGTAAMRVWFRQGAQFVEPLAVQLEIEREVRMDGDTVMVEGRLDLLERRADGNRAVVDNKMGGRRYGATELYRSTQALVYPFCTGAPIYGIHAGVILKASEAFQAVYREIDSRDADLLGHMAIIAQRQQRASIASGDFMPNRGHQLCTRRWCDHWRACEKRFGGKVPA